MDPLARTSGLLVEEYPRDHFMAGPKWQELPLQEASKFLMKRLVHRQADMPFNQFINMQMESQGHYGPS
ncbi:hypothetical protein WJX73_005037 [Symbiochloris irregularis]|uniref:Uncharacterized protein n=1 Tax=Symbiochloris irregularis TaxID=706552 RepID=A0AAW1NSD9_9CHLO